MRPSTTPLAQTWVLLAGLTLWPHSTATGAPPAAPPPPKEYEVHVRYQIYAPPLDRLMRFASMIEYLESIGFKKNPGEDTEAEDATETLMTGRIASANARKILEYQKVKSILLLPAGYQPPQDGAAPVKVQIELAGGLALDRQRILAEQVLIKLRELGFREAIAYDHRGRTRLVGAIPAGNLEVLLKDLRWQPSGWLVPDASFENLPSPLKNRSPIIVTEVIPEPEGFPPAKEVPAAAPALPREQEHLLKISSDLRALAARQGQAVPVRMEVILNYTPDADERGWRRELGQAAPGSKVEGILGPIITVLADPKHAPYLAELAIVSTVRLPRPASPVVLPKKTPLQKQEGKRDDAFRACGLPRLHQMGFQGAGVRVAVIDGDFRGYQALLGKKLPEGTRYVDFTTERNANLEPDPFPGDLKELGHGTQCAMALALAAPGVELTLIRIDPAAPYQLLAAARYISGEEFRSESIHQRREDLVTDANRTRKLREQLEPERRAFLESFGDDEDSKQKRAAYLKKEANLEAEERALVLREKRFLSLQTELKNLKGIRIVSCSLVWNDGYPVGGASPLTRYFDDRAFRAALWFQPSGNTRGQGWSGLFRDADGNGVMEFTSQAERGGHDWWRDELNFLGWQPFDRERSVELPAKTRLRISIQWREAHDPEFSKGGEDVYRQPLANLRLLLLRQRDPSGKKVATDDLEFIAQSTGLPERLDNQPAWAVYEQALEVTIESAGRYALRVEGKVPESIRPPALSGLHVPQTSWELRPRIFVDAGDPATRLAGRPVFLDHSNDAGGTPVPSDARSVLTIGAADFSGRPQPYSINGPPPDLELLRKPNGLVYDQLHLSTGESLRAYGTCLSAPLAAGMAAVMYSAGGQHDQWLRALRDQPGRVLTVP